MIILPTELEGKLNIEGAIYKLPLMIKWKMLYELQLVNDIESINEKIRDTLLTRI